jgi:hypothetical protein
MKLYEKFIKDREYVDEQMKSIGKGLSKLYKTGSKILHYSGIAAGKAKLTDIERYLFKHRDITSVIGKTLENNPSPENIKIALIRVRNKASVGLIAGLIIIYAYRKYIRNWSAAGRYCKGTTGTHRTACLRRYKIRIMKERLNDLVQKKLYCGKSKDPQKCKTKVDSKIKKLKERISVLQTQQERYDDRMNDLYGSH